MCGAPVSAEATRCDHCQARLATVACPACFGMLFRGTRFCPHCGVEAKRTEITSTGDQVRQCPRCRVDLTVIAVGDATLQECPKCDGLWASKAAFEKICADKERQGAVLGRPAIAGTGPLQSVHDIRYVPCPDCKNLMHRVNFANCSGVIVDVCRNHGTWFDRHELGQIVAFIQAGGMELARERQKAELALEEQRLRRLRTPTVPGTIDDRIQLRSSAVFAARDLLDNFFQL